MFPFDNVRAFLVGIYTGNKKLIRNRANFLFQYLIPTEGLIYIATYNLPVAWPNRPFATAPRVSEIQCISFTGVASIAIHTSRGSDHYAEHQLLFSVRYRSCSGWMASIWFSILVEVNQDDTSVNQTNVGPQHLHIWLSTWPVREQLLEQYALGKVGYS